MAKLRRLSENRNYPLGEIDMQKLNPLLLLILIYSPTLLGQTRKIDSLKNELRHQKVKEERIYLLDDLSIELIYIDPEQAEKYAKQGLSLCTEKFEKTSAAFYGNLSDIEIRKGDLKKALSYLKKGLSISKIHSLNNTVGRIRIKLGSLYQSLTMYDSAEMNFKEAITYFSEHPDTVYARRFLLASQLNLASNFSDQGNTEVALETYKVLDKKTYPSEIDFKCIINVNSALIFASIYNPKKAIYYYKLALTQARELSNLQIVQKSLSGLCFAYYRVNKDSAINYCNKGIELGTKFKDFNGLISTHSYLGEINLSARDYITAKENFLAATQYSKLLKDTNRIASNTASLGLAMMLNDQFEEGIEHVDESMGYVSANLRTEVLEHLYNIVSKKYFFLNDFKNGDYFMNQRDSVLLIRIGTEKTKALSEIETKYETEKKEKEILRLENERQAQALQLAQNRTVQYGMGGGIFLLLLSGLFFWRDRQRRLLIARYEAEESEKHRIARELHDGLAGEILLIQRSIPDQLPQLQANLLRANRDLRNFSHQLDAKRKSRSPLPDILSDYINHNGLLDQLQISVDFFPKPFDVLDGELKSNLFRIWQELLTNTLKHSGATHCSLQLAFINKKIEINYEDNGVGVEADKEQQGLGLSHIRERVGLQKGKVYQMEKESGFSIKMEFPVKKSLVVYS